MTRSWSTYSGTVGCIKCEEEKEEELTACVDDIPISTGAIQAKIMMISPVLKSQIHIALISEH